ncbi:OLC1v1029161C1 [Oldenlandia corymbosa var. corymbosa]|uniref:OLC1v1029161C1 n=1 Tax=Oldenlandia corymbosa var. corymbosa TaxID=529605 RepID=A0AAV1CDC3_OLDCO|nr:OLC1v1029161C1 [Oldenlandia corymbosa var. corymbosa]
MGFKWKSLMLTIFTFLMVVCNASLINSNVVRSIKSEDGDVIDCIPIHKQPAFDHPALQNHSIQMRPSNDPTMAKTEREEEVPNIVVKQLWQKSGSCPQGTIPIRRTQTKEGHIASKKPSFSHLNDKEKMVDNNDLELLQLNHSLAVLIAQGFAYYGAKGDIKLCYAQVERDDEYTTNQVSLITGPFRNYEAIESGWAVNPGVYGDRQTRLFVYWTVDGSVNTGCFDLTCPGFVQTSSDIALGAPIYPISDPEGNDPSVITIFIHKDPETNNWWVNYGEEVNIGYWPAELFNGLCFHAESVQWGGDVYSKRVGMHPGHTATGMGCGQYPSPEPFFGSAFVKRMRVIQNKVLVPPAFVNTYADEYRCYRALYLSDYVEDPEFYYGGPGRNFLCP